MPAEKSEAPICECGRFGGRAGQLPSEFAETRSRVPYDRAKPCSSAHGGRPSSCAGGHFHGRLRTYCLAGFTSRERDFGGGDIVKERLAVPGLEFTADNSKQAINEPSSMCSFERGMSLCEKGEIGQGMLWLA